MSESSKISITNAYATPILTCYWENSNSFNVTLAQTIINYAKENKGIKKSNVDGYHSDVDFIHQEIPPIIELKSKILEICKFMAQHYGYPKDKNLQINLSGWANILTHGNYHRLHNHPDYHWSGIYYVSAGAPFPNQSPNGFLQFNDPRSGANMVSSKELDLTPTYLVAPRPGLLVAFPSYLEHYVHPFFGEGKRISVAFNAKLL